MIRIVHTHQEGTLIYGSHKGDGVWEIVRQFGFTPFHSLGMLGIRNSRDHVANRWRINGAAGALRQAGFEVEAEIDDQHRDRATVLADQADRLDDRKDALERKAAKHEAASDAAYARADQLSERFYMGQPILIGHHSEKSARADQRRMHQAMDKSCAEQREATETSRQAAAAGKEHLRRLRPGPTRRRIDTAKAEIARIDRTVNGYTRNHLKSDGKTLHYAEVHQPLADGDYKESLLARRAQLVDQVEFDEAHLAELVAERGLTIWDRSNVHIGDLVTSNWGRNRRVIKLNPKTCTLETPKYSWDDKCAYTDIHSVTCTHGSTAEAEPVEPSTPAPPQTTQTPDRPELSAARIHTIAFAKERLLCACGHVRNSHSTEQDRGIGSGQCGIQPCDCQRFTLGPEVTVPVCHRDPAHGLRRPVAASAVPSEMRQHSAEDVHWCGAWFYCTELTCMNTTVLMPSPALLDVLGWRHSQQEVSTALPVETPMPAGPWPGAAPSLEQAAAMDRRVRLATAKAWMKCRCGHPHKSHAQPDTRGAGCREFQLTDEQPMTCVVKTHGPMQTFPGQRDEYDAMLGRYWHCRAEGCHRRLFEPFEPMRKHLGLTLHEPLKPTAASPAADVPPVGAQVALFDLEAWS